jgi:hypothetical protein
LLGVAGALCAGCGTSAVIPLDQGTTAGDVADASPVGRDHGGALDSGATMDRPVAPDLAGAGDAAGDAPSDALPADLTTDATSGSDGPPSPDGALVDDDQDGIDDRLEAQLAADYLPFLSLHPQDGCALGGMLYRAFPHPDDPTLVSIVYDHLYQNDCGLNGHIGDDEVFGITVDPTMPAPDGIVAMVAISHQGTFCEVTSECGRCAGQTPCETLMKDGKAVPVVYSSQDKHGSYVSLNTCNTTICFDNCAAASRSTSVMLANAGEPSAHLIDNLTTQAFVTAANGWTEPTLLNFDPWDPSQTFGGAGNIAGDLTDSSFIAAACH